ncbi:MAG: leucine-rich repeat domain-containing protein [Ruminococcaceae bacterium]|nr:leucine-rich repeat domain-containing protein [Oscillospiraceae bacterium]
MNKRYSYLLIFCLLLLCVCFGACSKDDDQEPVETQPPIENSPGDLSHSHAYGENDLCEICGEAYVNRGLSFEIKDGACTVTKYQGTATVVNIPSKYKGVAVTAIGEECFSYHLFIEQVLIPKSVRSIEKKAFLGCVALSELRLPDSLESIGNSAFMGCESLTEVVLPDSVTLLDEGAFALCTAMTKFTMGSGITRPGKYVFRNCSKLTEIILPATLKLISNDMFDGCASLSSVSIPDGVEAIGHRAFLNCDSLTDVVLPESVLLLGQSAFQNCDELSSITIPESMLEIRESAFENCTALSTVRISNIKNWCQIRFLSNYSNPLSYGAGLYLNGELVEDLVLPEGITTLTYFAFFDYAYLKSVVLPESLLEIGGYAFGRCQALRELEFKSNITNIWEAILYECENVQVIRYAGTREQWEQIEISEEKQDGQDNSILEQLVKFQTK